MTTTERHFHYPTEDIGVWARQFLRTYDALNEDLRIAQREVPEAAVAIVAALLVVADRTDAVAVFGNG